MFESLIRTIPDYPKAGIQFRDITTLLQDKQGFSAAIDRLSKQFEQHTFDKIVAMEARGFIIGAALAVKLGIGFVPARKPGKLPWATVSQAYTLEYGIDTLEMHEDAIKPGERILLVDDLIATGGTALAVVTLVRQLGGVLEQAAFVIDLPELGGMQQLANAGVQGFALCQF
ncbi:MULTISPECIES: adenine phosphoribosyltransferase [unclassified Methylophilus]|nr:adenine phosphoribosyltransferase [Methylophilus sp. Leaf416]KQT56742.1 adenine phosphoribosyltransferase [Methylophilus sp. Leaf459]